jgi:hypothetical protein
MFPRPRLPFRVIDATRGPWSFFLVFASSAQLPRVAARKGQQQQQRERQLLSPLRRQGGWCDRSSTTRCPDFAALGKDASGKTTAPSPRHSSRRQRRWKYRPVPREGRATESCRCRCRCRRRRTLPPIDRRASSKTRTGSVPIELGPTRTAWREGILCRGGGRRRCCRRNHHPSSWPQQQRLLSPFGETTTLTQKKAAALCTTRPKQGKSLPLLPPRKTRRRRPKTAPVRRAQGKPRWSFPTRESPSMAASDEMGGGNPERGLAAAAGAGTGAGASADKHTLRTGADGRSERRSDAAASAVRPDAAPSSQGLAFQDAPPSSQGVGAFPDEVSSPFPAPGGVSASAEAQQQPCRQRDEEEGAVPGTAPSVGVEDLLLPPALDGLPPPTSRVERNKKRRTT